LPDIEGLMNYSHATLTPYWNLHKQLSRLKLFLDRICPSTLFEYQAKWLMM